MRGWMVLAPAWAVAAGAACATVAAAESAKLPDLVLSACDDAGSWRGGSLDTG